MMQEDTYIPRQGVMTAICRTDKDGNGNSLPKIVVGRTYDVDYVMIGRSWSKVCLSEYPEREFNASCFTYKIGEGQMNILNIIEDCSAIRRLANIEVFYTTLMICRDLSKERIEQIKEWRGRTAIIINRLEILDNLEQKVNDENEEKLPTKNIAAAKLVLSGAVGGDIIGSYYESHSAKYQYDFQLFRRESRFTDDTVCSIAIADSLIKKVPFDKSLQYWCRKYPKAGYGFKFRWWMNSVNPKPYNSWGNGSAMRVSSIGAYADSFDEAMELSKKSAEVTHNHPEGIKGAQATAVAIYLALHGKSKDEIKSMLESTFNYNLSRKYDDFMPRYVYDVSCQGSVPESIISFLESEDYESAVRKSISLGGDADTMAAIAGGIAAAYYGAIPQYIISECLNRLPDDMKEVIIHLNSVLEAKDNIGDTVGTFTRK